MGRGVAGGVETALPATASRVGVDGCRAGWLAAAVVDGTWHFEVFEAFESLWEHLESGAVDSVLVDVPVGLRAGRVRECDEAARALLGARWNAVFRTPVSCAIELKRMEGPDEDYRPVASAINDARTGHGVSVQAWNIADGVAELDSFFDEEGLALDGPVREAHPELAYMAFEGQPIAYSKTGDRGRRLRERVLAAEHPGPGLDAGAVRGRFDADLLAPDDVLDAAVLALAADEPLRTTPETPGTDQPRIYYPDRPLDWEG